MGAFFVSDERQLRWNEEIGSLVYCEGDYDYCKEGWGTVFFRDDGLLGARKPLASYERYVVFYGDSFVESLQVGDSGSVYTQFTELAQKSGRPWRGLAVAASGWNLEDHVALLPIYAKRIPRCVAHVIVISGADMVRPESSARTDPVGARHSLTALSRRFNAQSIAKRWQLQSFFVIVRSACAAFRDLRLRPGPVLASANKKRKKVCGDVCPEYYESLLDALQDHSRGRRIVVVYHSLIPQLNHGRIDETDPFAPAFRQFRALCRKRKIECLDATPALCEYTRRSGRFPHGFANSFPGQGHWNRQGHRLIAQVVLDYLMASQQSTD
ncbi:MAG: SGNH/GDSL hydrolase family protein [Pirellulales bacterium]|nr:SGNH/GDSL hydrolase family protein [Pirellulales bacterium]